jgi:hypothetical protein
MKTIIPDLTTAVQSLFEEQLLSWPLASKNYTTLSSVISRDVRLNDYTIKIQFNPERIRSANAKIDKKSVERQVCFLCKENEPEEQKEIPFLDYSIRINPYPIFPLHLTISDNRHLPQLIKERMRAMLSLARNLPGFTLLYNGPESGASAPDHFHFQAGSKGFMPVEQDVHSCSGKKCLKKEKDGYIYTITNYLRECIIFESKNEEWLLKKFNDLIAVLHPLQALKEEPMFNIITWMEADVWLLIVFPRKQHRPRQFYETGNNHLLISPGVVDFGGVLITVRKEDFEKIDRALLSDIYAQLTLDKLY